MKQVTKSLFRLLLLYQNCFKLLFQKGELDMSNSKWLPPQNLDSETVKTDFESHITVTEKGHREDASKTLKKIQFPQDTANFRQKVSKRPFFSLKTFKNRV